MARHRPPAHRLRHQPRPRRRPVHPSDDRSDHGDRQPHCRPALRLARPAPARSSSPLRISDMTTADVINASPVPRGYFALINKIRRNVPFLVGFGIFWLAAMVLVAIFADLIRPYDITAMDLSNRLSKPGNPAHWLGTDELGRDVLSRLIQ